MTSLSLPLPHHMTHEYRARRSEIIRWLRKPSVEITVASIITFAVAFGIAAQV